MSRYTCNMFAEHLNHGPYTSVGCYPVFFVMCDGGVMCHRCAAAEKRSIRAAIRRHFARVYTDPQWIPLALEINWEDPQLHCDGCNGRIESAYAESEAGE